MHRLERSLIGFRIDQLTYNDHVHHLEWQFHGHPARRLCAEMQSLDAGSNLLAGVSLDTPTL
jgi:hypothetical protein